MQRSAVAPGSREGTAAPSSGDRALGADKGGGCEGSFEQQIQEVLTATYWLDSGERGKPYSVSVKFSGRRLGVIGKPQPPDHFVRVETVDGILPASGPVSITAHVSGINSGEWIVTTDPVIQRGKGRLGRPYLRSYESDPRKSFWRRWLWWKQSAATGAAMPVKTRMAPFARIPGIYRPAWPALVLTGVAVGLAIQALLIARAHLDVRAALAVSLAANVAGYLGAKVWFLALHRRERPSFATEGLCIQGFVVGASIVLMAAFAFLHQPVGAFLDAAAPGLLLGMAIGRPGCILAGCCVGRPTASRWGVWASDRRLGIRRVPTQLLEAIACLAIGVVALILVLQTRPALPGVVFVGALAGYTLCRQILLPFRAEPRKSSVGPLLTTGAAGLVLIALIVASVR